MKQDRGFYEYVIREALHGIPNITSRKMFGGYGLYKDGIIFGLLTEGRIYFKVNDSNRADFEARNSKPFEYIRKRKTVMLSYWELPAEVLENSDELPQWIEKALEVRR